MCCNGWQLLLLLHRGELRADLSLELGVLLLQNLLLLLHLLHEILQLRWLLRLLLLLLLLS